MELFSRQQVVGVFRGFREGGMEFHANLVLPYRNDFQRIPMHGYFVLVQLETPDEAVLGRIASFSSEGKLSFGSGEEFNIRAVQEQRPIPEDLREQYLKYRVNIRVLGVLRNNSSNGLTFVPSHRRLPHVGSKVAFPSGEVLREICGHNIDGAKIGHFALGEYIYANINQMKTENWMRFEDPEILVRFPVQSLVARRSFVFARAGFGKSNLTKLLFSELYKETPTIKKRGNRDVPVGTVIFDPDGEYFWPDDKGRPGLCDVKHLQDNLVVFTARSAPSSFYGSFIAGGIKLDIRQLRPSDVISIALSPERQDQQNVAKLRALSQERWTDIVNLIDQNGNSTNLKEIAKIMNIDANRQEAEAIAARSNITNVVGMLHDKSSQFMNLLIQALKAGKVCIVDISQMRGTQSFILAGIILRRIFDHNQNQFIQANPQTIPVIAVIEEAQAVLNERAAAAEPYISWVKEGRKYDLGALLITQQPGSIPNEILSQGDNWFIFHLLSAADLINVKRANAHFSDDLLSSLLNEPIPGQGVFWSSVGGKPYPISIRTLLFENICKAADQTYSRDAVSTFANELKEKAAALFTERVSKVSNHIIDSKSDSEVKSVDPLRDSARKDQPDVEVYYRQIAKNAIKENGNVMKQLNSDGGALWGYMIKLIEEALPETLEDRHDKAYNLVAPTMTAIFEGPQDEKWEAFTNNPNEKRRIRRVRSEP
ncbi:MAG: DUF87 domain-containing protein [Cyanobacteria bacterium MAG IRC4_bin_6]|nr:DUF87 domain-containing protein [Cyanobacteria bacterium MAG IRC4_bin_6]